MLLELANNKQDELKQAFLQKIILGGFYSGSNFSYLYLS